MDAHDTDVAEGRWSSATATRPDGGMLLTNEALDELHRSLDALEGRVSQVIERIEHALVPDARPQGERIAADRPAHNGITARVMAAEEQVLRLTNVLEITIARVAL